MRSQSHETPKPLRMGNVPNQIGPVAVNRTDTSSKLRVGAQDNSPEPSASQVDTVRQRSGQDTQPSTATRKEKNKHALLQNGAGGGGTVFKCRYNQCVTSTKTPSDSKPSVDPEYSVTALDNTATNERSSRHEAVFFKIFIGGLGCFWVLMISFKLIMPLVQTILPVSLNTMPPVLLEGLYGLSLLGMGCCLGYALKVVSKWPYASTLLFLLTMSVGLTCGFLSLGWPVDFLRLMDWMPVMILTVVSAVILSSTCSAFKQIAILRRTNFVEEGSLVVEMSNNPRGTLLRGSESHKTAEQESPVTPRRLFR